MRLGSVILSQFPGVEERRVCFHDDPRARFLQIEFRRSLSHFRNLSLPRKFIPKGVSRVRIGYSG